ncbi:hypothetical protein [Xanthomonas axonopodis]
MSIRCHVAAAIFLLSFVSFGTQAQTTVPTTGLGTCIDFITSQSTTLTEQINSSPNFTIAYGSASYTDMPNKAVYIQNYSCESQDMPGMYFTVSALAHEFGHVKFNYSFAKTTRQAYIDEACKMEGLAVTNNIVARNEIWSSTQNSIDINLAASNPDQLFVIYYAGGPNVASNVGKSFCANNVTSTTGQNYNVYYGEQYDKLP